MSGLIRLGRGLGLAALVFLPLTLSALEVEVHLPKGQPALLRIRHTPSAEPLGALRVKVRFHEAAVTGAMTLFRPAEGPWSQVQPELRRDGPTAEILALAPAIGESRNTAAETVAEMAVPLAPGSQAGSAEDLVDSVWIEEALLPWGGKSTVTHRLTTSILDRGAFPQEPPREKIQGAHRTLSFALARDSRVRVRVMDARGRMAVKVFDGRKGKGMQEITWDGRAAGGRPLPAGTYFLRLEAGTLVYDRKLEVAP